MYMSQLTHIFSSVLGIPEERIVDSLSPETESAWDSLNAIILITEIEHAFDLQFEYDEAMAVKDFKDAVALISAKGKDPYA